LNNPEARNSSKYYT